MSSSAPPPGWYPDNQDQNLERWFDGSQWTSSSRPKQASSFATQLPQPASPVSHSRSRKWPWIAVAVIIAALAAIGVVSNSGKKPAKTAQRQVATTTSASPTATVPSVVPESSAPAAPLTMAAGDKADFTAADGSDVSVTVGNAVGTASQNGLWAGFPVTVAGADSTMSISGSNFTLGPVKDGDDPTGIATTGESATFLVGNDPVTPVACKGLPYLDDAMQNASTTAAVTGCVVFGYAATDHPTALTYYPNGSDDTSTPPVIWTVHAASPRPTAAGIIYTVTSDGGISSVTYTTAGNGQGQDTNVPGTTWRLKIANQNIFAAVLIAQNAGDGTITCTITVDGKQVAKQSSHGAYAVVTCDASP